MPEGWTFANKIWGDSTLVMPTTGYYAFSCMKPESELAITLGFRLSASQVLELLCEAVDNGFDYSIKYDIINGNRVANTEVAIVWPDTDKRFSKVPELE